MRARVYRLSSREFICKVIETGEMVKAMALGNIIKNGIVVGDFVELIQEQSDQWVIKEIEQRSSEVYRLLVRENTKKVTASNVERMVILSSVSKPQFKRGIVERFLIRALQWGIYPLVVFNKMDEYDESRSKFDIRFEIERLKEAQIECFEMSAIEGDSYESRYSDKGLKELKEELKGKTAIFLGQSGVGKSKTIGLLSDGSVDLKTQKVGKVGKGSHTTTWSEIVEVGDFLLMDSPGIRSFSLEDLDPKELIEYFPDLYTLANECQFKNCEHLPDSKGCAFYNHDRDSKKQELILSRLESYLQIKEEIGQKPEWAKKI